MARGCASLSASRGIASRDIKSPPSCKACPYSSRVPRTPSCPRLGLPIGQPRTAAHVNQSRSHPTPLWSPSKRCGSAPTTGKRRASMSGQSRSLIPTGMHSVGYEGSQLVACRCSTAGAAVAVGATGGAAGTIVARSSTSGTSDAVRGSTTARPDGTSSTRKAAIHAPPARRSQSPAALRPTTTSPCPAVAAPTMG